MLAVTLVCVRSSAVASSEVVWLAAAGQAPPAARCRAIPNFSAAVRSGGTKSSPTFN